MEKIASVTLATGEELVINHHGDVAGTYKIDFGDAGGVRIVVPPGGSFTVIGGNRAADVKLESTSDPGLQRA